MDFEAALQVVRQSKVQMVAEKDALIAKVEHLEKQLAQEQAEKEGIAATNTALVAEKDALAAQVEHLEKQNPTKAQRDEDQHFAEERAALKRCLALEKKKSPQKKARKKENAAVAPQGDPKPAAVAALRRSKS